MYAFITGKTVALSPAMAVLDNQGIGYEINISINTYSAIQGKDTCKLFTYLVVREDAQLLYGFATEAEKELFVHLISVSGIGPNTARMVLSSFPPEEIVQAILQEDEATIKSIKGIGPKSAKRLILELKDKLKKGDGTVLTAPVADNTIKEEALSALVMLGFNKNASEKAIAKVLKTHPDTASVEALVKLSLKNL